MIIPEEALIQTYLITYGHVQYPNNLRTEIVTDIEQWVKDNNGKYFIVYMKEI